MAILHPRSSILAATLPAQGYKYASFIASSLLKQCVRSWRDVPYIESMKLDLPDDPVLQALSPEELRLELACAFYSSGRLSREPAARLAGLDRGAFDEELFRRRIPSYTDEMLQQDLAMIAEEPPR